MKVLKEVNISESLRAAKELLAEDKSLSSSALAIFSLLVTIVELLLLKFGANSKNSSLPPSKDPNGLKKKRNSKFNRKKTRWAVRALWKNNFTSGQSE